MTTIDGARYVVLDAGHEVMWLVRPTAYRGALPIYTRRRPTLSPARVVSAAARAGEQVRAPGRPLLALPGNLIDRASSMSRVDDARYCN